MSGLEQSDIRRVKRTVRQGSNRQTTVTTGIASGFQGSLISAATLRDSILRGQPLASQFEPGDPLMLTQSGASSYRADQAANTSDRDAAARAAEDRRRTRLELEPVGQTVPSTRFDPDGQPVQIYDKIPAQSLARVNIQDINRAKPSNQDWSQDFPFDLTYTYDGIPGPIPPGRIFGGLHGTAVQLLPENFSGQGLIFQFSSLLQGNNDPALNLLPAPICTLLRTNVTFNGITVSIVISGDPIASRDVDPSFVAGRKRIRFFYDGSVAIAEIGGVPTTADANPVNPSVILQGPFSSSFPVTPNPIDPPFLWAAFESRIFQTGFTDPFIINGMGSTESVTDFRFRNYFREQLAREGS